MSGRHAEKLAITSDYAGNKVALKERLKGIAKAGFTDYMHCHGWKMSEQYTPKQIRTVKRWVKDQGLGTVDVHASVGASGEVWSEDRETQNSGLEIVRNRIHLADALGANVIVLHTPSYAGMEEDTRFASKTEQVIEGLTPALKEYGVRVAFENCYNDTDPTGTSNFPSLVQIVRHYPADLVGLCLDNGHANVTGETEKWDQVKDRILAVHLHGNTGESDQHDLPEVGNVPWQTVTKILAESSYKKPLSLESSMRDVLGMGGDAQKFLKEALAQGQRLVRMLQSAKA